MNHLSNSQLDISVNCVSKGTLDSKVQDRNTVDTLLSYQESLHKEKSRVNYLANGDINSAFFHALLKRRRVNNALLPRSSSTTPDLSIVVQFIPSLVTDKENISLTKIPSAEENKSTNFSFNVASAPRPDGFTGVFYQHYWDIFGLEFVTAVQDFFFSLSKLFSNLNLNFIFLIPKVTNAISVDQYRPIVVGNFLFKVVTKIIASHLSDMAARIISLNQFGFVKGRQIQDCIAIASDCINALDKHCYEGNIAIKIDIRKAFDTMN
ncbi:hypothetical protein Ddye_023903 [Dipteronia dyeriana]|uniref:Reverse transcriptase domain-containing protein n=1 Tax=Dipteronia dyeriana TaxID=168575 RepID=A0AAD9TTS7_9ROSI|nr:hypothetical protein Ddye_023903 [Dipteronia dyeriana]